MNVFDWLNRRLVKPQPLPKLKYSVCPICNGAWTVHYFGYGGRNGYSGKNGEYNGHSGCKKCGIQYYFNEIASSLVREIGALGHPRVMWLVNRNVCRYEYPSSMFALSSIMLPWLPFTITKEELEKYLILL